MAAFGTMGKTEWNLSVLWETRVILSLLLASFAQGVLQLLAVEGLYFFFTNRIQQERKTTPHRA